jgi:hypothetical protein
MVGAVAITAPRIVAVARFVRARRAMRMVRRLVVLLAILSGAVFSGPGRAATLAEAGWPPVALWRPLAPSAARFPAPPAAAAPGDRSAGLAVPQAASPGEACRVAILAAAARHGIPADLLLAISLVESGRRDPVTGTRMPWPWTANAEGQDYRFETSAQAAAWVRQKQAGGLASIDTGCMQVNLRYHPEAFATVEDAFDPVRNADYAARFLRSLHDGPAGGVWMRAAGFYHSQTPERAEWYQGLVEAAMKGGLPSQATGLPAGGLALTAPPKAPPWPAGGGGQSLSNHAELARIVPLAGGQAGRGLDAYRAAPILLASRSPPGPPPGGMALVRR